MVKDELHNTVNSLLSTQNDNGIPFVTATGYRHSFQHNCIHLKKFASKLIRQLRTNHG